MLVDLNVRGVVTSRVPRGHLFYLKLCSVRDLYRLQVCSRGLVSAAAYPSVSMEANFPATCQHANCKSRSSVPRMMEKSQLASVPETIEQFTYLSNSTGSVANDGMKILKDPKITTQIGQPCQKIK